MDVLLTTEPVPSATIVELAASLGLEPELESPWTDGVRQLGWHGEGQHLELALDASSGAALLVVVDEGGSLGQRLREALPCEGVDETIARARAAQTPRERVRQVFRLATLLLAVRSDDAEPVLDAIGERLLDDEPLVRWAAARVLRHRSDRHTVGLLAAAVERHDDLAPVLERVTEACRLAEDGTLYDEPTDNWWELVRRAREGVANETWPRVLAATEALLESSATHEEGLMLRALAHEHEGNTLLGLALLAAAGVEAQTRIDVEGRIAEGDTPSDEAVRMRSLLDEIEGHRARISAAVEAGTHEVGDALTATADTLVEWFRRWDYHALTRVVVAQVVLGRLPSIEGLLALEAGAEGPDVDLLRRAVDLVPDAPECRFALAQALEVADDPKADQVFRDTLRAVQVPVEERSVLAQRIAASRRTGSEVGHASVLHQLTSSAYEARQWDDAIRWADELVQVDPGEIYGWQIHANARIFGGRLEEAADAFVQTLEALDEILAGDGLLTGDDPRPQMRFNWSAVLAKLGRHDEALEQLRRAVRADGEWGDKAREDDFFEALWEDPTFLAVAQGEPEALVLDEEREPGYLEGALRRCVGLSHMSREDEAIEACERTIELGELLQRPDAVVRALAVLARTLALAGDVEEALERSQEAMARHEVVPLEHRAEVVHTHGLVLHQAERFDEAQDAYEAALALRAEAHGDDHPVLAKGCGDLARLASARGDDPSAVEDKIMQGLELLDRWLAREDVPRDDTWLEAEMDACIMQVNRGHTRALAGDVEGAVEAMEDAAERIEGACDHGTELGPAFLDNAIGLARDLAQRVPGKEGQRAAAVVHRLETAQLRGPSEEVAERLFWRRLQGLARRLSAHGVDDAAFAGALGRALRGELSPQELGAVPEMQGLQMEISTRVERYPTLLTMMALGLSTVESGGASIQETLESFEELCVGSLYTEGGPLADA